VWPVQRQGFEAIEPGLRRIYRQGRRALGAAQADPSTENLHEWRKREKDLWYHLRLLHDTWPGPMGAAADEASTLADLLGDDHDLAVLLATARELGEADGLEWVVRQRRSKLQADAFELGRRLYAERPRAFSARLRVWWESAR
jgi:CHAD domain-containing protein